MNLSAIAKILPTLILSACCCCDIDWLVPDAVGDAVGEAVTEVIIEQGVGLATGGELDIEDGSITITGEDGETVSMTEGDAVSSKLPITVHPGCPISMSMAANDANNQALSASQTDCAVPLADLRAHYSKELKGLGGRFHTLETPEGAMLSAVDRDPTVQVVVSEDKGRTSVMIVVGVEIK